MTSYEESIGSVSIAQEPARAERQVWDLPVRIFHWSLVGAVVTAFVTNKLGVSYFKYHVWAGYAVIVLVAFRIVWGVVGTRHARFWNFLRGPSTTLAYARDLVAGKDAHYAGHNPLGALMVLLLLALLAAQAAFGLFANDEILEAGPFAGIVSKAVSLGLTSLHRKLFYVIAGAAALHVGAVLWHWRVKGENLIAAMITGKKSAHLVERHEEIRSSRGLRAIALLLVIGLGLALLLHFAPPTEFDSAGL
jgi:cytochrome b